MKSTGGIMTTPSYNEDLNAWLQQQVSYLREGKFDKLDIDNLIEEVESVGKSERRSIKNYFVVLIGHLLKLKYRPEKATGSWYFSITNSQRKIKEIIEDSPSLKREMQEKLEAAWKDAINLAVQETGLPRQTFPAKCPWTAEQAMRENFDRDFFR